MKDLLKTIFTYSSDSSFVFTNYAFWVFFFFVLMGNALLYKKSFVRNGFLFICSLFFYYKAGGFYFGLLLFSTVVDYIIGLYIYSSKKRIFRRLFLTISLVINLGLLCYFKYSQFISDTIYQWFDIQLNIPNYYAMLVNSISGANMDIWHLTTVVGISFYTFQTISYSVDVYKGKIKPVKSIIDFGFYVSFFPQLVAGPIVRAREFIPQLHKRLALSEKWFWWAVYLILSGLFKKMVLSNYISLNLVDRVFDSPMMYSGVELLMGAYGYTLQIYCDFSGYTDIAIGVALLLGFRLPLNFNLPYRAYSVTDFWRRWHISLSTWLRDYLYIPLGGNRKGKTRQGMNLMITMLLGGLWHGAGWTFIIWGGLHGLALLIDKVFIRRKIRFPRFVSYFITFHFIVFTWIVFRIQDFETFNVYWSRMFNAFSIFSVSDIFSNYAFTLFLIVIGFLFHWFPTRLTRVIHMFIYKANPYLKACIVLLVIFVLYQFSFTHLKPFIYFQF